MLKLPSELESEICLQHDLVTRAQLIQHRVRAREINARLDNGHWQAVSSRVIKISPTALTRTQELVAACLHHQNLSLTGVAALEFQGLGMDQSRRIDLIGPRGTRVEVFEHAILHTSRREFSVLPEFPARTCHDLSVVYAMAWARTLKQARHFAYWSIQRNLVTLESLSSTVFSNRHSPLMKMAIPRVLTLRDKVDTVHEHLFASLCKKAGIDGLVAKPEFVLEDGTAIHPDFGILKDGRMLAIEIDGIQHESLQGRAIDELRMRFLRRKGVGTFRVLNRELTQDPDAVQQRLLLRLNQL